MVETTSIQLENAETLLSKEFKHELAKRVTASELSRMGGFVFLMSTILDHRDNGGKIINEHGAAIYIHGDIVEEAFSWAVHFSWISEMRKFAKQMPKRRSKSHLLLRMQLFDAAYKILGEPIIAK